MKNIKISYVTSYFRRSVSVRYICEAQTRLNISLFQRALDQSHQPQLMVSLNGVFLILFKDILPTCSQTIKLLLHFFLNIIRKREIFVQNIIKGPLSGAL